MTHSNCYIKRALFLLLLLFSFFIKEITAQDSTGIDLWTYSYMYVDVELLNYRALPSPTGDIWGQFKHLQKILIVNDEEEIQYGWSKVVYPQNAYCYTVYCMNEKTKKEKQLRHKIRESFDQLRDNSWSGIPAFCNEESSIVFDEPEEGAEMVNTVYENQKVLVLGPIVDEQEWVQVLYPVQGYVDVDHFDFDFDVGEGHAEINLYGTFSVVNLPFEKFMDGKNNPYGGVIEFTRSNWDGAFGVGYNRAESNLEEYELLTETFFLYYKQNIYSPIRNLDFYLTAGLSYWTGILNYSKYTEGQALYFVEEKDNGLGFNAGAGLTYNLANILFDVRYVFFGTNEAIFGYEAPFGDFRNKYTLFTGSNQLQIMLGYKIEF